MYTDPDKKNKNSTQNPAKATARRTRHTTPIPAQRHGDNGKGKTQFVPQENKYPEAFASGYFGPAYGPYLIGMLSQTGKTRYMSGIQNYSRPIRRRKHSIVFSIRQQIVIGPTPPGTGVM